MNFQCKFCLKEFKFERAYMTHRCDKMERAEEIRSLKGKSAYIYYKYWMEKQRRKTPSIETFATSMFYKAFTKFYDYVKKVSIPSHEKYIDLMIQNKISPVNWDHSDAYSLYLDWTDKKSNYLDQVEISIETIGKLCDILEIEPKKLFSNLKFGEVFQLLQERKLSPWLLLCSSSFKDWIKQQTEDEHKHLLRLLNMNYWSMKFEKHQIEINHIKTITKELGI